MIKITGGELKGRSISSNSGLTTRPTGAKVREALFNIIGNNTEQSKWLDLFGGTGIIGIEAISRKAENVTFTEIDYSAFNLLKKNISNLNITKKCSLIKGDAIKFLANSNDNFDFIFIDPPYASDLYQKAFDLISKKPQILQSEGILIVEHNSKTILPDISLSFMKSYKYGDTSLSLYKHKE